jgi:DNA-binding FadR family transcriptional regulator
LLEVGVAGLAASKRTPVQLEALMDALEGMRHAKNADELVEPDVRFHLALLEATNNDLLIPLGLVIEHALTNLFRYTSRNNPRPDIVIPLHEAVAVAVASGDPRAARLAMAHLLDDTDTVIAHGRPPLRDAPAPSGDDPAARAAPVN